MTRFTHTAGRLGSTLILAGLASFTGGCLVMVGSSVDEDGVLVSGTTLGAVETGTTTRSWLIATLGEPTSATVVEGQEHVEILKYRYTTTEAEGGTVFLLWAGGSTKESSTTTYFELVDNVVTRYWTER